MKKAKKIEADKRAEEIQENLKKSTKQIKKASKELDIKLVEANDAMIEIVETANPEHQQPLANVVVKVNKLLAQLKKGGDVNDIVNQLKKLQS